MGFFMKIIQICGPSYSGSTALGYILNTGENIFFGSEVCMFLDHYKKQMLKRNKDFNPKCDVCGDDCSFWDNEFRHNVEVKGLKDLSSLYRVIEKKLDGRAFVDGSKKIAYYRGNFHGVQLLTAKHPIRMLASFLYNRRQSFAIKSDDFSIVRRCIEIDGDTFKLYSKDIFEELIRVYEEYFVEAPNLILCRTDKLSLDDFKHLKEVCVKADVEFESLDPLCFSQYDVHPVGGNRAPLWLRAERQGKEIKDNPRRSYYTTADSTGDVKVDDKYKSIFPDSFLLEVLEMEEYKNICKLLGYSVTP